MHLTDQEHIDELESEREQFIGDMVDVCHSAKKIILAYMGYQEDDIGRDIDFINRILVQYEGKTDRRPDAREWWNKTGVRRDISKWSTQQRMEWAYAQGLKA